MKFLADENFPRPAVEALRRAGFDVAWVMEDQASASDEDVLARSQSDQRTLLTFDKDFGELAFRRYLEADSGIILFRLIPQTPDDAASLTLKTLRSKPNWAGYFTVVTRNKLRMTPLPMR